VTWARLVRAELRKLTTTKMPLAFLCVLAAIAAINGAAVVWGTDFDGSKGFIATAADQRSLIAFAANAVMGAGLFGAIAVAREYGHGTVIPTYLAEPRRHRAVLAQLVAVGIGGAVLATVGAVLSVAAVAVALTTTEFDFLVPAAGVVRVIAAAAFAGAVGAVLGAGIGAVVRNTGGAVTGVVLALIIVPPLLVQLVTGFGNWVPSPLAVVLSGVPPEAAGVEEQVGVLAAVAGLAAWALVPAVVGLVCVQRRDVA
jgi:ABC-2 type transport system permease protein